MTWIEKQSESLLRSWLQQTKAPVLATLPNGDILWCNHAFECLLGYNNVELVGRKTWMDLTASSEELPVDVELMNEAIKGIREDYQLQKPYRTKSGKTVDVLIDVIRYPVNGEFECFLVTVFPLEDGLQFAMGQLSQIRALIIEIMAKQPQGLTMNKIHEFAKEHPFIAAILGLVLATLLFGERVLEVIDAVRRVNIAP